MKMQFKFLMQLGALLLTATLLTSPVFAAKKLHEESLDKIAAIVDESVITESELDQAMDSEKKQMMSANQPLPNETTLRKQVLDQLINRKLQLLLADQLNIHISDADVNQAVDNVAKANNFTTTELYNKVTEQGMSVADYRKNLREEITLQKVQQQEVGSKIVISPDEVKKSMHAEAQQNPATTAKEYNIVDTLVPLPDSATSTDIANAQKKANKLLTQLRQGKAQADAAATTDFGWRTLGEIPSAFVQQVQQMKKNDFTGPIQTSNGFHLLHLVDVRTGNNASAASGPSMQEAEQIIYQRKMDEALKPWIAKLRSGAYINTHPDNAP